VSSFIRVSYAHVAKGENILSDYLLIFSDECLEAFCVCITKGSERTGIKTEGETARKKFIFSNINEKSFDCHEKAFSISHRHCDKSTAYDCAFKFV
jgi:hypothetical protein